MPVIPVGGGCDAKVRNLQGEVSRLKNDRDSINFTKGSPIPPLDVASERYYQQQRVEGIMPPINGATIVIIAVIAYLVFK
jgi:hypothetical protein